jgi:1-acyl-sn-glycerol-3-phosphate acyltransferase
MRLLYWTGWFLTRVLIRIVFRMKAYNVNNIPSDGPFILACNHISLADPPVVGSNIKRVLYFMAKKELFGNKLFGWLIRNVNAYPVNRRGIDRGAIDKACEILDSGKAVLIFPEGTRALENDFLPPRPGIGMVARRSKVPVVPAYLNGTNKLKATFLNRERCFIIFGKPIDENEIGSYDDDRDGYRKLAEDIMIRIKSLKAAAFLN